MVAGWGAPLARFVRFRNDVAPAQRRATRLIAGLLLLSASGAVLAQTLACRPKAPRTDPGAGFAAFGANEQALARAGSAGAGWEWALGPDTDGSAKAQGSADWTSGRTFAWTLTYSAAGSAQLVVRDGATTVLALQYPSGMDAGNALELRATMNSSIGPDTSIRAAVSSLNDKPAAGGLALAGSNQAASQALYFYYPPMSEGFTAQGNMVLNYATLPTGARASFTIRAGMLPCTNQPPSVALASLEAGAVVQGGRALTLNANAADPDGSVARVEFFANGVAVGAATAAPFSVQWTPQAGNYLLSAVATDNAGDEATSGQVAIVANAQPTISITAPASGTILQLPGAVTLTAGAADSDGTVSKVDFFQGTTLLGTATGAPYSYSVDGLPAGSYTFSAIATDDRGGMATSASVPVVVNAPPTVSVTSSTSNVSFRAPANISLAASAIDSDGTISNVAFYNGDTLITTLSAAPYAFIWGDVPQGTYSVTARVTDNTGYTVVSQPLVLTVIAGEAKLYFISVDHLNTPRAVFDDSGTVLWRWDQQEPFGDSVADEDASGFGAFEMPLRFPGQYLDKETSLHYNNFRDYDAALGRFVQSDPIGLAAGIDPYLYAMGRPILVKDVLGLKGCGSGPSEGVTPNLWFGECCDAHDGCYEDCEVNAPSKQACDDHFCRCVFRKCTGWANSIACRAFATGYCTAVKASQTAKNAFLAARGGCQALSCGPKDRNR